jgi:hypothetical protein
VIAVKRALNHPTRRRFAEQTAESVGVSLERFFAVLAVRKRARYLQYHRRRAIKEKPRMTKKNMGPRLQGRRAEFAPMSELYGLLKANKMTVAQFLELSGISHSAFYQWYGFPMHKWPIMLLRYKAWADNMAAHIIKSGMDPRHFLPKLPALTHQSRRAREHRDVHLDQPE